MTSFEDALFRLWPNGDVKIPGLRRAMVDTASRVFETYGINTKTAMNQFMAQISHECGAGLDVEENLNYTAARMTEVWPTRFRSISEALPYAHNPRALGNKVYNGRMGNAIGTDDGYNFRGRGATQVTGKEGYAKLGAKVGLDLINHPELVNLPANFMECGAADFVLCGCLLPALSDDIHQVTLRLNGGLIGYSERQQWLAKWKALNVAIPLPKAPESPSVIVASNVVPINPAAQPAVSGLGKLFQAFMSLFKRN